MPKTKEGVLSYLGSGLIKGIGKKTAEEIVAKFGTGTLDILEKHPERLLEVRGITENKLEDIRTSFAESRMLRDIMTLLAPFKLTPKTALKIYQHFGPACLDLLRKSPFELCQIPGFGFRRVDAIVRKTGVYMAVEEKDKNMKTPANNEKRTYSVQEIADILQKPEYGL